MVHPIYKHLCYPRGESISKCTFLMVVVMIGWLYVVVFYSVRMCSIVCECVLKCVCVCVESVFGIIWVALQVLVPNTCEEACISTIWSVYPIPVRPFVTGWCSRY